MLQNINFKEIIKFGIVGLLATSLHYGCYYLLLKFTNATVAFSIGYLLGFIVNFYLSTYFTFSVNPTLKRGIGFLFSNIINYGLSIGLLNLFLYLGVTTQIAPLFVFSICVPLNFLLVKYFLKK